MNGEIDNGLESVPSVLLEPVAVTVDNINDTIIKDQFWSVDEICAGKYAAPARRRVSSSRNAHSAASFGAADRVPCPKESLRR